MPTPLSRWLGLVPFPVHLRESALGRALLPLARRALESWWSAKRAWLQRRASRVPPGRLAGSQFLIRLDPTVFPPSIPALRRPDEFPWLTLLAARPFAGYGGSFAAVRADAVDADPLTAGRGAPDRNSPAFAPAVREEVRRAFGVDRVRCVDFVGEVHDGRVSLWRRARAYLWLSQPEWCRQWAEYHAQRAMEPRLGRDKPVAGAWAVRREQRRRLRWMRRALRCRVLRWDERHWLVVALIPYGVQPIDFLRRAAGLRTPDAAGGTLVDYMTADRVLMRAAVPAHIAWRTPEKALPPAAELALSLPGHPTRVVARFDSARGIAVGEALERVGASAAWTLLAPPPTDPNKEWLPGSPDRTVAVLDSAVTPDHESLPPLEARRDFVRDEDVRMPWGEQLRRNGHGTACAGLAVGRGRGLHGARGIAPGCRLVAARVAGTIRRTEDNSYFLETNHLEIHHLAGLDELAHAIRWAAQERACDVLSMSFEFRLDEKKLREAGTPENRLLIAVRDAARRGGSRGARRGSVLVAAAGNWRHGDGPPDAQFPARFREVLAVAGSGEPGLLLTRCGCAEPPPDAPPGRCGLHASPPCASCRPSPWALAHSRYSGDKWDDDPALPSRPAIDLAAPGLLAWTTSPRHLRPDYVRDGGNGSGEHADLIAAQHVHTTSLFGATSASAPLVAGAAALVLSANPSLRACEARHVLRRSAWDEPLRQYAWTKAPLPFGELRVNRAVQMAIDAAQPGAPPIVCIDCESHGRCLHAK